MRVLSNPRTVRYRLCVSYDIIRRNEECDRGAISNASRAHQYFKGPTYLEYSQRGQTRAQRSVLSAGTGEVVQSKRKRY